MAPLLTDMGHLYSNDIKSLRKPRFKQIQQLERFVKRSKGYMNVFMYFFIFHIMTICLYNHRSGLNLVNCRLISSPPSALSLFEQDW